MNSKCKNCGAVIEALNTSTTYTCQYCGTVYGDEKAIEPIEQESFTGYQPVVPFSGYLYAPTRGEIFKRSFLLGFLIWLLWGVVRAFLPLLLGKAYEIDAKYTDTLFYSHVGSLYYVVRAGFLLVIFPLLMCTVFYNKLVKLYGNK